MRALYPLLFFLALPLLNGCTTDSMAELDNSDAGYDYVFKFTETENTNWTADFADYPADQEEMFQLRSGSSPLPKESGQTKPSLMLSGHNYSDDLFMYLYRKVEDLKPNTPYLISFNVELASNAPRNSVGIGGSPGASVYLKAGAIAYPPAREKEMVGGTPYWLVNFDKGNQAQEGKDMTVLGHIGTNLNDFTYTLIDRSSTVPFSVTTNEKGELWLLLGIDSGFEGETTLYFTKFRLKVEQDVSSMAGVPVAGKAEKIR
ncbi:hypothetical protein [Nafulsella turpanensis]|uniref:hypothetical protein n=1 Tax=Nafulsella turpanensis TaxID=1265690 RepID=UPI00034C8026|nr:hypothetical protein [Nafulsella turpanensis]